MIPSRLARLAFVVTFAMWICAPHAWAQPRATVQPDPDEHWVRIDPRFRAKLRAAQQTALHGARARQFGAQFSVLDTFWIGHRSGQTGNYWEVGVGPRRPLSNTDGMWSFDSPVHGDSLQGWSSIRMQHTNISAATQPDVQRPWWAVEAGNQVNFVNTEEHGVFGSTYGTRPGDRTFGVIGVWHSDPGNTGAGAGHAVGWTPLSGARSAWMGLRRHGDLTVSDPLTGNAFNADVAMYNNLGGSNGVYGIKGTARNFPGYGSQMDQLLYRDVDVSGSSASVGVTLSFKYATTMSTGKNTNVKTRVGWFDGDPLKIPSTNDGNFISAEAGSPANALAPVDSFEVYIGAPEEGTFHASDGSVPNIYDPLRRWFNEILNRNARKWMFGAAGNHSAQTVTVSISSAEKAVFAPAGILRVVFRVHTNRNFDDEGFTSNGAYTSNGAGAAQLDDVKLDQGSGPVTIGDFEGGDPTLDINNDPTVPATSAWKSTGKPPSTTMHVHDLSTLAWSDLCGPLGSPNRLCDMQGVVVSMGDHDRGEQMGGPSGSANENGNWGIISPTINLMTPSSGTNGWDISANMFSSSGELIMAYDIYTGGLDAITDGLLWQFLAQSYPAAQADGSPAWGEIRQAAANFFNPDVVCFPDIESLTDFALVQTTNSSGIPDSIRVMLRYNKECYRFGLSNCGQVGNYLDNMSFGLVPNPLPTMSADPALWFQDTFPFSSDSTLVGTAAFDTTSALVRTGYNTLQGSEVPGDSLVVAALDGDSIRVDLVFRIRPGPGNYVLPGNVASGLRRVPTSTIAATPGDGSFWGTYMGDPGAFASAGAIAGHAAAPSGWSSLVWNSARCDTQETNLFPQSSLPGFVPGSVPFWQSTYHENDSHYSTLGIPRHRCFIVDTTFNSAAPGNVSCTGAAPAWVMTVPRSRTGWDGTTSTIEGTQILPDGLLTPGTHVEYFVRRQDLKGPSNGTVTMMPDTNVVYPQVLEGSLDAHRWQQFSVLPDRWKANEYGGDGSGCMLVVDIDDGRGDELAWVSISDSTVWGQPHVPGAHNGWSAPSGADINNPAYFVNKNAQPGGLWDLYNVKGGGYGNNAAGQPSGSIGSRYQAQRAANSSVQGPSLAMLKKYYKTVMLLSGDAINVLGPNTNVKSDDTGILREFLTDGPAARSPCVIAFGDNIASDLTNWGGSQADFLHNELGVGVVADDYKALSGDLAPFADLATTATIGGGTSFALYGVADRCFDALDVIAPDPAIPTANTVASYEDYATASSFGAIEWNYTGAPRYFSALTGGFSLQRLASRSGVSTFGRIEFFSRLAFSLGGAFCNLIVEFPDAAPTGTTPLTNHVSIFNNPLASGSATIHFGLAKSERAEIRLYDLSGRLVRVLADRAFAAGEHVLTWDGLDDHGHMAPRGVYFARTRYAASGFEADRRIVLLK